MYKFINNLLLNIMFCVFSNLQHSNTVVQYSLLSNMHIPSKKLSGQNSAPHKGKNRLDQPKL